MIKINLVNAKKLATATSNSGEADPFAGGDNSAIQRQGLMRLIIILLVPLALYAYEMQNIPELQARLASKRTLLASLTEKNAQAATAVEEIKKYEADQAQLQKQISTLESFRRERLREVKIMDNLQKDIPEKLWLTKIVYDPPRVLISGITIGDLELTTFMDAISKSIFFSRVNLIRSSDTPMMSGVQTKSFEISCDLETQDLNAMNAAGGGR